MRHLQFKSRYSQQNSAKNKEKEDSILIVIALPTTKQYFCLPSLLNYLPSNCWKIVTYLPEFVNFELLQNCVQMNVNGKCFTSFRYH